MTKSELSPVDQALNVAARMEYRDATPARNVSVQEFEGMLSAAGGAVWDWVDRGHIPEPLVIELGTQPSKDVFGWPSTIVHWWLWSNTHQGRRSGANKPLPVDQWPEYGEPVQWATVGVVAVTLGMDDKEFSALRKGMGGPPYLQIGAGTFRYPLHLAQAWADAREDDAQDAA